ncbi:hypothetical protein C8R45DRAFT_784568, partial [Mycena sanguinolenta]
PPPRSLSAAATQTDTVDITPVSRTLLLTPTPAPLDWAEDAAILPIFPTHSAPPLPMLRDFSALCTGSSKPFASLQRRHRRSPRPLTSSTNHLHSIRRPPQKYGGHYTATRRAPQSYLRPPPSIHFPAPTTFPLSDRPAAQFPLDWDQDPRLRDLGQALAALGWV